MNPDTVSKKVFLVAVGVHEKMAWIPSDVAKFGLKLKQMMAYSLVNVELACISSQRSSTPAANFSTRFDRDNSSLTQSAN
jgi:hypothetical protein